MVEVSIRIEPHESDVCDFCSDQHTFRVYAASDFVSGKDTPLPQVSEGAWAACKTCSELIDQNRKEELVDRAASALRHLHPSIYEQTALRIIIQELHTQFWAHRRADA